MGYGWAGSGSIPGVKLSWGGCHYLAPATLPQSGQQRLLLTFLQVNAKPWGPPELRSYPGLAIYSVTLVGLITFWSPSFPIIEINSACLEGSVGD